MLIVGQDKVGKSTFAASSPSPVGVLTEEGLDNLDVPAFPLCETYKQVLACISTLIKEEHQYKTLFLDSLDWAEPLVHAHVCQANGWDDIEKPGYGKGYAAALTEWRRLIRGLEALRAKGMNVIAISHSKLKKVESPLLGEAYDTFALKMNDKASAVMCEWADIIGYLDIKIAVSEVEGGNKSRGVSSGERILRVSANPGHPGGNRYGMKDFKLPPVGGWDSLVAERAKTTGDKHGV